jgi:hypothetical protein
MEAIGATGATTEGGAKAALLAEYIGRVVRQQRGQPVITTTPAGVHIGTQVFAVVGTNEHPTAVRRQTPTPSASRRLGFFF